MVKPSDHSTTLQNGRCLFQLFSKGRKPVQVNLSKERCFEERAKSSRSWVDRDPSLQLWVNSLKGKIKKKKKSFSSASPITVSQWLCRRVSSQEAGRFGSHCQGNSPLQATPRKLACLIPWVPEPHLCVQLQRPYRCPHCLLIHHQFHCSQWELRALRTWSLSHHLPAVSGSSSGQLTQNRILSEPGGTGCPKIAANTSLSCTTACVRSLVSGCLVRSPAVHFNIHISHSLI